MIQRTHTEKRLLEQLQHLQPAEAVLARCEDAPRCARLYRGILVRAALTIERGAVTMEALLGAALQRVPDPERALVHLDRFLEASMSPSGLLEHFLRAPKLLEDFLTLVSASQWLADTLVRDAGLFRWLMASELLERSPSGPALREAARAALRRFERPDLRINALRRFQRRELLRITAADLLGRKAFPQVVAELSGLADAVLSCVFDEAVETVQRRRGAALHARIAVLALGKLGGGELNYSSDIDLMVVYESMENDPTASHDASVMVVKEMLRMLTEHSAEGALYRTDLRLRPDGAAGALALSVDASMTYYERRGALWERQMLLRARACAGDMELGVEVLRRLEPFVYPRTTLRPPSEMLADVHARLAERWKADRDVKHMRGGIRHIGFSLKALQMLHAKNAAVRTPSTMASIDAFGMQGLLTPEEQALLGDAYVFLRRVEHAIQVERFEQSHALPEEAPALRRIAWVLGHDDADRFARRLARTRAAVTRICEEMLGAHAREEDDLAVLPEPLAAEERARTVIHDLLFGRSSAPRSTGERHRLRALLPQLLGEIAAAPLPMSALRGIEQFTHTAGASGGLAYLEHPGARRLLLQLATLAPAALRALERDPLALELVFSGWEEVRLETARLQLVASTSALASLLLGDSGMREYGVTLTRIADTALRRVLGRRHDGSFPFAVLAMGKYGSGELIPGSDLDVILFYESDDPVQQEQAQRLARDIVTDMRGGAVPPLYEVDARLRPEGRSAPLAVSVSAWERYLDERASLWERQSLLRARIAAGDEELGARIVRIIETQRTARPFSGGDIEAVKSMRLRMEPENRFRQADFIDVKKSAGGLVDAEFAAQVMQLADPRLRAQGTEDVLEEAASLHPAIAAAARRLRAQYAFLRRLQLFLRLLLDTPSNLLPAEASSRGQLAAAMRLDDAETLLERLRDGMAETRRYFGILLDAVSSLH